MAQFVTRYALDGTGVNPANRVSGELHTFPAASKTLIAPKFGYYFKDNLQLINPATSSLLGAGQFICTEYYEDASLKYGKAIYGSILITDDTLTSVTIGYNTLGGENTRSVGNILSVYADRMQPDLPVAWDDLLEKPTEFTPKVGHMHNFDEVHDWIRLFKYLEDIKEAMLVGHMPAYNALMDYIDDALDGMERTMFLLLDDRMPTLVSNFKAQFTKTFFGVDRVSNMLCATNQEGRRAAGINYKQGDVGINKYMTLSSLVSFKEGIYDGIVRKFTTNLDTYDQRFVIPSKASLFDLENGANASYIGMESARTSGIPFDNSVYPTDSRFSPALTVSKLSNGLENRGGLFHNFDVDELKIYLGVHLTGDEIDDVTWKKYLIDGNIDVLLETIIRHIQDTGNPHQVTKEQILLGVVENLPVVTKENILNMTSAREYLTMDTLIYFMRAFLQQNAWHVSLPEGHRNRFLLDNCQVVFSPCGSCGCSDRSDFQPVPPPPEPTCPAANTLLRTFCSDSPENEPDGDEPLGVNKYGVYTDGECGEETRLIKPDDPECGYAPPSVMRATVEIRDMHNRLIGMGYGPQDRKDPNATVEILSATGILICNIYPFMGDGYDSSILDGDGSFIGFAVNP